MQYHIKEIFQFNTANKTLFATYYFEESQSKLKFTVRQEGNCIYADSHEMRLHKQSDFFSFCFVSFAQD